MTADGAIKVIQNETACEKRQITGCDRECGSCDLVLSDTEVIAAYESAIQALEKQSHKQKIQSMDTKYHCPVCDNWVAHYQKYCDECGQNLTGR